MANKQIFLLLFGLLSNASSTYLPNGCPADFSVHRLLPHETDCSKFYSCSNGEKALMECPPLTLFDYELQTCDWANNVNCEQQPPISESTPTSPESMTTIPESDSSESASDYLPNGCPINIHEPLLLSHETDCDKYYMCAHGNKILFQCPSPTLFDKNLQTCNWAQLVECRLFATTESIITTTEFSTSQSVETTDTVSSTEQVTETVESENNRTEETTVTDFTTAESTVDNNLETTTESIKESTTTSLVSSETPNSTTEPGASETESVNPIICQDGFFGTVPHPDRCDAYYLCSGWDPIPIFCMSGLEFDPASGICVPISEGGCTWYATSTITTTESTTKDWITLTTKTTAEGPEISTMTEFNTDSTTKYITTEQVATETESVDPIICPEGFFGNVPHPDRCDAYYLCSGWDPIPIFCMSGLEFDPVSEICVPISEGGCTWYATSTIKTTEVTLETSTTQLLPEVTTEDTVEIVTEINSPGPTTVGQITTESGTTGGNDTDESTTYFTTVRVPTESTTVDSEGVYTTNSWEITESATTQEIIESTLYTPEYTTSDFATTDLEIVTESHETTAIPGICPDGFFGSVPNPDRCDAYYLCSGWVPIPLYCSSGFEFDPTLQYCVPILEGGCTWYATSTTKTTVGTWETSTIELTPEINTPEPTTVEQITTENYQTTSELTDKENTSDPTDSTKDWVTVTTKTTTDRPDISTVTESGTTGGNDTDESTTDFTTVRVPTESTTVDSEDVYTTNSWEITESATTQEIIESTLYTPEYTTPDFATTDLEIVTESHETTAIPGICPDGFFGSVPNPDRCDAYYLCSGWVPIPLYCSSGFEFDPTLQYCVPISEGGCTWYATSTTKTTTGTWETSTIKLTPDESTEDATEKTTKTEPATTEHITTDNFFTTSEGNDKDTTLGSTREWTTTTEAIPTESEMSTLTTSGTTENNNLETSTQQLTTDGNIDDSTSQTSTESQDTQSTIEEMTISTESSTDPEIHETTTDWDFKTTETESADIGSTTEVYESTTTFEATTTPTICPDGFFGSVAHPERCDAYYMCSGWVPIPLFCPSDFEFDPELQRCVPITEGGCTWSQTNTTTTESNIETTTKVTTDYTEGTVMTQTSSQEANTENTPLAPTTTEEILFSTASAVTETSIPESIGTEAGMTTESGITNIVTTTDLPEVITDTPETTTTESNLTPSSTESLPEITTDELVTTISDFASTTVIETESTSTQISTELPESTTDAKQITTAESTTTFSTTENIEFTSETTHESTTSGSVSTTEMKEITTNEYTTTDYSSTENIEPTTPPLCPDGFFGSVPHPERCDAYYLCSGWMPIPLFCPEGYEFDPDVQTCVVIAKGGCTWHQTSTTLGPESEIITISPDITETTPRDLNTETETTEGIMLTTSSALVTPSVITDTTESNSHKTESITESEVSSTDLPLTTLEPYLTTEYSEITSELETSLVPTTTNLPEASTTTTEVINTESDPTTLKETELTETTILLENTTLEPTTNGESEVTTTILPETTTSVESTEDDQVTTELPEISTTVLPKITTADLPETEAPPICPDGFFGMVANLDDCAAYYMCSGWVPIPLRCPAGFEFNPNTQNCEEIAEGGCTWLSTSIPDTNINLTTELPEFLIPDGLTILESFTTASPEPEPVCPDGFIGMVEHSEDCSAYYLCTGWDPIPLFCSNDFEFDATTGQCVPISTNGCTARKEIDGRDKHNLVGSWLESLRRLFRMDSVHDRRS